MRRSIGIAQKDLSRPACVDRRIRVNAASEQLQVVPPFLTLFRSYPRDFKRPSAGSTLGTNSRFGPISPILATSNNRRFLTNPLIVGEEFARRFRELFRLLLKILERLGELLRSAASEISLNPYAAVERVVQDPQGVYAVTVRGDSGEHIVYVNSSGAVVQAPATTRTTTVRGATGSEETVITQEDIQVNQSRYELLEKKGDKEVHLDHQTGQKVIVKRKKD